MADITFDNIWKIYDRKVEAVKDLSFTCKDKEFFAILGPSGCGKTSSLRMLAGLEEISQGNVLINNVRVNDISSSKRNVAMSFENYGLYPNFTIFENIAYPLRIRKMPEEEIKQKVFEIAKKLRLTDVLNFPPAALSSGQKQRVSIARALVRNPDVTIMDEPLSHLDARMRSHMRSVIRKLHENLHLTTIYVTHDQIEAMTMADKILIMNEGVAQQVGTPDEVYLEPTNIFVAGFIGTPQMNLLDCKAKTSNGKLILVSRDELSIDASSYSGKIQQGNDVIFGIRPQNIKVSRDPIDGWTKGQVYVVEPLGETTIISIKTGLEIIKVEVDGNITDILFDDAIYFTFDIERGHVFDTKTGNRILKNN
ncbi:MAG: ABC transporter ATP-binding protein [Flexilinea sp.]